jgi:hypothetical protein
MVSGLHWLAFSAYRWFRRLMRSLRLSPIDSEVSCIEMNIFNPNLNTWSESVVSKNYSTFNASSPFSQNATFFENCRLSAHKVYKNESSFIMVSGELFYKHNSTILLQRAKNDVRSISNILFEFMGAEQMALRASMAEITLFCKKFTVVWSCWSLTLFANKCIFS